MSLPPPGGFIFKQWKKRFLLLTAEGTLLVCHDASSPPDQLVLLQSSCEAIVEGKEILDLPKLPSGGCRDCCFALILPQSKYLLLLAETAADCRSFSLSLDLFIESRAYLFIPFTPSLTHTHTHDNGGPVGNCCSRYFLLSELGSVNAVRDSTKSSI